MLGDFERAYRENSVCVPMRMNTRKGWQQTEEVETSGGCEKAKDVEIIAGAAAAAAVRTAYKFILVRKDIIMFRGWFGKMRIELEKFCICM